MSSILPVLAALTSLGEETLTDWQVINGPPGAATTTGQKLLIVGDAEIQGFRDLDSITLTTNREEYDVPLIANVDIPSTDQPAADALALAGYEAMEAAVREYPGGPNLGLAGVLQALPTGEFSLERKADSDGRHAAVKFTVHVIAQNT